VDEHRSVRKVCVVQVHELHGERFQGAEQAVDFERCKQSVVVDAAVARTEHPHVGTKAAQGFRYLLHLSDERMAFQDTADGFLHVVEHCCFEDCFDILGEYSFENVFDFSKQYCIIVVCQLILFSLDEQRK